MQNANKVFYRGIWYYHRHPYVQTYGLLLPVAKSYALKSEVTEDSIWITKAFWVSQYEIWK